MNLHDLIGDDIKNLRPMPASVVRLASLVQNPESSIDDIAEVVKYDPVLAANVLRWANSALWGGAQQVAEIKDGLIRLGPSRVLAMSVGGEVKQGLSQSFQPYGLSESELWRHSLAAGLAVEEIHQTSPKEVPQEAFTAALLHDIGKVIVHRYLDATRCNEMSVLIQDGKKTFFDAELQVLETTHAEIGAQIAEYWEFPGTLSDAIRYHHTEPETPTTLMDVVYLANLVAKFIGEGLGLEAMNMTAQGAVMQRLELSGKNLELICSHVAGRLPEIIELYQ